MAIKLPRSVIVKGGRPVSLQYMFIDNDKRECPHLSLQNIYIYTCACRYKLKFVSTNIFRIIDWDNFNKKQLKCIYLIK